MANPKICYTRLSDYYTLTPSEGSGTGHGTDQLQDYLRTTYWQSAGQTSGQTLIIRLVAAAACNYVLFDNNNLTEAGATLTLWGADDAGFTTNAVKAYEGQIPQTQICDINAANYLSYITFGPYTRLYWKFIFDGTLTDEPSVGNLFLGSSLDFTFPCEYGAKLADSSFETTVGRALSGTTRASQAIGGKRLFDLRFTLLSDAWATQYRTFHDTIRGDLRPFYFSPDAGVTFYWVRLVKGYNPVTMYRYGQNNIESLLMETADAEVL